MEWFGIGGDRVELITQPTIVEQLVVAPQGEQYYGPGPEAWYMDLLDAHVAARFGTIEQSGSLYVSRAGLRPRFAGESYLEQALAANGFRVLRPETVPLEQQVHAYCAAESIVFAGGSAIHGVQLMGRGLGDVTVLPRREGRRPGEVPLMSRARSLRYVDAVRGVVHGRNIQGVPADTRGLTILDPQRLLEGLPIGDAWDPKSFDEAVAADVEEWLQKERASRRWNVPGSPELVAESMRAAGL